MLFSFGICSTLANHQTPGISWDVSWIKWNRLQLFNYKNKWKGCFNIFRTLFGWRENRCSLAYSLCFWLEWWMRFLWYSSQIIVIIHSDQFQLYSMRRITDNVMIILLYDQLISNIFLTLCLNYNEFRSKKHLYHFHKNHFNLLPSHMFRTTKREEVSKTRNQPEGMELQRRPINKRYDSTCIFIVY